MHSGQATHFLAAFWALALGLTMDEHFFTMRAILLTWLACFLAIAFANDHDIKFIEGEYLCNSPAQQLELRRATLICFMDIGMKLRRGTFQGVS